MSNLVFKLEFTDGDNSCSFYSPVLESHPPVGSRASAPYFVLFGRGSSPPSQMTLSETWNVAGCHVFVDVFPDDIWTFGSRVISSLDPVEQTMPRLAWVTASEQSGVPFQQLLVKAGSGPSWKITGARGQKSIFLQFGRFWVSMEPPSTVRLDEETIQFQGGSGADGGKIAVEVIDKEGLRESNPSVWGEIVPNSSTGVVTLGLPVTGDDSGSVSFQWNVNHALMQYQFGTDQRGFYSSDSTPKMVRYPLFTPPPNTGTTPLIDLYFDVKINASAPFDDSRTHLSFSRTKSSNLVSNYLRTTTGRAVSVEPAEGPAGGGGLCFCRSLARTALTN